MFKKKLARSTLNLPLIVSAALLCFVNGCGNSLSPAGADTQNLRRSSQIDLPPTSVSGVSTQDAGSGAPAGAGVKAETTPGQGTTPAVSAGPSTELFFAGRQIIEKNCLLCHSIGPHGWGISAGASLDAWTAWAGKNASLLTPLTPTSSLIYQRINAGTMPPSAPLSFADVVLLKSWLGLFVTSDATAPSPIPTPLQVGEVGTASSASSAASPKSSSSPLAILDSTEFAAARPVLETVCLGCHTSNPIDWGMNKGAGEDLWIKFANQANGRIVPGPNWAASNLYQRLRGNTAGDQSMPPAGIPFSTLQFNALVTWVKTIPIAQAAVSPATPSAQSFQPFLATATYDRLRLSDRNTEGAKLLAIFGSSVANPVNDLVTSRTLQFGGNCVPRDQFTVGLTGYCNHIQVDAINYEADAIPLTSPVRQGLQLQVCYVATLGGGDTDAALQHAITLITGNTDLGYLSTNPVPTQAQIGAAFAAFNHYRQPDSATLQALTQVATTATTAGLAIPPGHADLRFEPWRYLIETICADPEHQIH